jgi:hypothetical protein
VPSVAYWFRVYSPNSIYADLIPPSANLAFQLSESAIKHVIMLLCLLACFAVCLVCMTSKVY